MTSPPTRRVVDVIELLAAQSDPLSATAIATSLRIARATATAILAELTDAGWVERRVDLGYVLGPGFPNRSLLSDVLTPSHKMSGELAALAGMTRCGVTLSVIEPNALTVIDKHHGSARVIAGFPLGQRIPLRYPAGASVMPTRPEAEVRQWMDGAGDAADDAAALLDVVRSRGVAVFRPRDDSEGLVDVLADVLSVAGAQNLEPDLRRRIDRQLSALTSRYYSDADFDSDDRLPVSYLTAPVAGTRYEIQLAPLHSDLGRDERWRLIGALLDCAARLGELSAR